MQRRYTAFSETEPQTERKLQHAAGGAENRTANYNAVDRYPMCQPAGDPWRLSNERGQEDAFDHNLALLDQITALGEEVDATSSQLSLAWLMAKGDDVIPIPGSRKLQHLRENLGSADIHLTPEQVARIDAAFPPGVAKGGARGGHSPRAAAF